MIWWFYNLLFVVAFIVLMPRFLWRMRRRGGYARDFMNRIGRYRPEVEAQLGEGGRVWLHAVSVGEVFVALDIMKRWRERDPSVRFVLSVTTSTGHAIAERELPPADALIYFPVDFPPVINRVLDLVRPAAIILVEIEIWPNLIRSAHRRGIPVMMVNGRMSERSHRGYRKLRAFTSRVLPLMSPLCMQSDEDAARILDLGARPDAVTVTGSAKYDIAPDAGAADDARVRGILRRAGVGDQHMIMLGGSTWPGEEDALIDVYKGLKSRYRRLVLVLVPRHVERRDEVVGVIRDHARTCVLRSSITETSPVRPEPPDVLLVDTTGELKEFYACADVIFVGKSLTRHGGQNIIEPAVYGKPIVVGPHMENFRAIVRDFEAAGALIRVETLQQMRRAIDDLLDDPDKRHEVGTAASGVVQAGKGAIDRMLDLVIPSVADSRE